MPGISTQSAREAVGVLVAQASLTPQDAIATLSRRANDC
jgi:hypothetical protein